MIKTRRVTTNPTSNKQAKQDPPKATTKGSVPVSADLFAQPSIVGQLDPAHLKLLNKTTDPKARFEIISHGLNLPQFDYNQSRLERFMGKVAPDLLHTKRFKLGPNQAEFSVLVGFPTRDLDEASAKVALGLTNGKVASRPMPDREEYWDGIANETETNSDARITTQVRTLMRHDDALGSLVLVHQDPSGKATRYLVALYPDSDRKYSLVCVKEELGPVSLL